MIELVRVSVARLTSAFQPQRLMIAPSAGGCKRVLASRRIWPVLDVALSQRLTDPR
jgi:hypothetical protein